MAAEAPDVQTLLRRLGRVELDLRRWKRIGAARASVAGLLAFLVLWIAFPSVAPAQSRPTVIVPGGPAVIVPTVPPYGQPAYCISTGNGLVFPRQSGCMNDELPLASPVAPGQPTYCRSQSDGAVLNRPWGCPAGEIPMGAFLPSQR